MNIFSVDPSLDGGWALTVDGRADSAGDMPVFGEGANQRVSAPVFANYMRSFTPDLCVVEIADALPGKSGTDTFRSGMAYGAALAVPAVLGVSIELVTSAKWKQHFKLRGADRDAGRHKALDLCPWLARSLDRKRDARRAGAVLIGLYAAAMWDTPALRTGEGALVD